MLILSWNVAGLSSTVNRIHDAYGAEGDKQSALKYFFNRHKADIVCLQEHKVPRQSLANRSDPKLFATTNGSKANGSSKSGSNMAKSEDKDYESFWSCCVDATSKGFNGVVTYAIKGLVTSANATTPLNDPELDAHGRCVMTHHDSFVLFNVYVPCRGGAFKMKFLRALRNSMRAQREKGNPVILVGDLNISYGKNDVYWKERVVCVDDILHEVANSDKGTTTTAIPQWKMDVSRHWRSIEAALATKEVVSTTTTNSRTHEAFSKFRLSVTIDGNRKVFLGNHEACEEDCLYYYNFGGFSYWDDEIQERTQMKGKNVVSAAIMTELLFKICNVQWTEEVMRQIADEAADVDRHSPSRKWLHSILNEDGMIDAFRHFYPHAKARFTCWNQNKNCRYVNQGTRIDYTLVDRALLPHLQRGDSTLRCDTSLPEGEELSEFAALKAVTASGRYQPAAFEGGGIVDAPRSVLDSQFGPPHTGHVYTPPTFSDHIGVSVLLDDCIMPRRNLVVNINDVATRKAQPHMQQRSVTDFFKSGSKELSAGTAKANKRTLQASPSKSNGKKAKEIKPPANSVLHHFRKAPK